MNKKLEKKNFFQLIKHEKKFSFEYVIVNKNFKLFAHSYNLLLK